jgi:hypothetical protein
LAGARGAAARPGPAPCTDPLTPASGIAWARPPLTRYRVARGDRQAYS